MRKTFVHPGSRLFVFGAVFALVLMVLAACANPQGGGGDPGPADKTSLETRISNAENAIRGIRESTDGTDVAANFLWVMPADMAAMKAAISGARVVFEDSTATQKEVDDEISKLRDEMRAFLPKRGTAAMLDDSDFNDVLENARNEIALVIPAADAAHAPNGSEWVTQVDWDTLNDAIGVAVEAYEKANIQANIDSAKTALESTLDGFEQVKASNGKGTQTGNYSVDQLKALIVQAGAVTDGVKAATSAQDGKDFGPKDRWIDAVTNTALTDAVSEAKLISEAGTLLDDAYNTLAAAIKTYSGNIIKGGNTPDRTLLVAAIGEADNAKVGVEIADSRGDAPSGSSWVTQADFDTFEDGILAARIVNDNMYASQTMVDNQTNLLKGVSGIRGIIDVFKSVVERNGAGTKGATGRVTVTGMEAYNALDMKELSIVSGRNDFMFGEPAAVMRDSATIVTGGFSVPLYEEDGNNVLWPASGSYYIGFALESEDSANPVGFDFYISKTNHNFSNNPTAELKFSDFAKQESYSMKPGDSSPNDFPSMSLDDIITIMMTDENEEALFANYADFRNETEIVFYKNSDLTTVFNGSDMIDSNTVIWFKYPIWIMNFGEFDLATLTTLKGTLTLNDLPADMKNVTVHVSAYNSYSYDSFSSDSKEYTADEVNSGQLFNWEIPVKEDKYNDVSGDYNVNFYVTVTLTSGMSYNRYLSGDRDTINISSGSVVENINLGTVNAGYTMMSGTVNVKYNNAAVPELNLTVIDDSEGYYSDIGNVRLESPADDQSWYVFLPKTDEAWNAVIRLRGSSGSGSGSDSTLFNIEIPIIGEIDAGVDKTGIVLDIDNLTNNYLRVLNAPTGIYSATAYTASPGGMGSSLVDMYPVGSTNTATGGSVSTDNWEVSEWTGYSVLIQSGNLVRTSRPVQFVNGIAVVDWNTMKPETSIFRVDNMVNVIDKIYVFPADPEFKYAGELDDAIDTYLVSANYDSYPNFTVLVDDDNEEWKGTDNYQVVLMNSYGNSDERNNPKYYKGTLAFVDGVCITDWRNFAPLLSSNPNNVEVTVTIHNQQDIILAWDNPNAPVVTADFTAKLDFEGPYENFKWFMDSEFPIPGAEASSYTVDVDSLEPGQHRLTLLARRKTDEAPFSAEIYFVVE